MESCCGFSLLASVITPRDRRVKAALVCFAKRSYVLFPKDKWPDGQKLSLLCVSRS